MEDLFTNGLLRGYVESGAVSEIDIIVALHKAGKVDAVKAISETLANIKDAIQNGSLSNRDKINKLNDAIEHLQVVRDILIESEDEEYVDEEYDDESDVVAPTSITLA